MITGDYNLSGYAWKYEDDKMTIHGHNNSKVIKDAIDLLCNDFKPIKLLQLKKFTIRITIGYLIFIITYITKQFY